MKLKRSFKKILENVLWITLAIGSIGAITYALYYAMEAIWWLIESLFIPTVNFLISETLWIGVVVVTFFIFSFYLLFIFLKNTIFAERSIQMDPEVAKELARKAKLVSFGHNMTYFEKKKGK